MPLTVGSLFAGIGGFDLAAERAGLEVRWQVENDTYATKVLERRWPHVRRYGDIREIDWANVEPVDVVCAGWPCQPHSLAGRRLASDDPRDLWPEVWRCLRALKSRGLRWFVGENVAGLLSSEDGRFFGAVLRDLAALGMDAEWDVLPAGLFGADHLRERVWLVAYPAGDRPQGDVREAAAQAVLDAPLETLAARHPSRDLFADWPQLLAEAGFRGVADGIPNRAHRLRTLGNSIYPPAAAFVFECIQAADDAMKASA